MPIPQDVPALPSRRDPVVRAASEVIGGPVGRYAGWTRDAGRLAWQPVAAALMGLAAVAMATGILQKAHCVKTGWRTPDQFWHACYSDLPVVYASGGLSQGVMPYLDSAGGRFLDQPIVSGLGMWLVGLLVPDGTTLARQQWYFGLWAVLLTSLLLLLVLVTVWTTRRTPWNAAHVAVSPVLVTASLVSVDLLGVLLASVALWAWGRRRAGLSGLLFGLAIATRSYPLVLVAAIGLLALRSGQLRVWVQLAATAAATWVLVSLPFLVASADGVMSTYRGWWGAGARYGSVWLLPGLFAHPLPTGLVNGLVLAGWVLALIVGAVFALTLERRPGVAEVCLVMLVVVVLTSKANPVQVSLWLLPLIALVGLPWRDHLIWAGLEVTYFVAVWLYIAAQSVPDRGLPRHIYGLFLVLRVIAWLYVLVRVWRGARSRWPAEETDQLADNDEPAEETDQLAGPMTGATDRFLVRFS